MKTKNRAEILLKTKAIVERLETFAKYKGETLAELSQSLGYSVSYFVRAKAGQQSFGIDITVLILEHYRDLSPDWLLFGSGSKFRGGVAVEKKEMVIRTEHSKIDKEVKKSMDKAKRIKQMFLKLAADTQSQIDGLSKLS